MPPPIDALLFDLGRVLVDIDMTRIHRHWAQAAGVSGVDPRATANLMGSEVFHRHERGEITDAAFFAHLRASLGLPLSDAQFLEGWNAIFIGEMAGIRDVLGRVEGKLPLYVFSNTNAPHRAYWSVHFAELLRPFEKIFVSNELGLRKPEPAAFAAVVAGMGVPAARVLFFDDSPPNVTGARACGLHAVEVTSTADVERALAAHGI
jgi:glucose-1-phosphatase